MDPWELYNGRALLPEGSRWPSRREALLCAFAEEAAEREGGILAALESLAAAQAAGGDAR